MDEVKLKTFLVVTEYGSFTKAAEVLFLSPVAVKNQIDALEDELGEKLFVRKATGCSLTPIGSLFTAHAASIISAIEKAKTDVEKAVISLKGEIIAGYSSNFTHKFLGALSSGFSEIKTNHVIHFTKIPVNELIPNLLKRQVNFVLGQDGLIDDKNKIDVEFHPIISLPIYAIMKKGHPLSQMKSLKIDDIKGFEIYSSGTLDNLLLAQLNSISSNGLKIIENTDRNVLFNRIMKNAIEIYPSLISYHASIPLEVPPLTIGIYVFKIHSPVMEQLVRFTKEFAQSLTDKNIM